MTIRDSIPFKFEKITEQSEQEMSTDMRKSIPFNVINPQPENFMDESILEDSRSEIMTENQNKIQSFHSNRSHSMMPQMLQNGMKGGRKKKDNVETQQSELVSPSIGGTNSLALQINQSYR